jgi:hypothetical protein
LALLRWLTDYTAGDENVMRWRSVAHPIAQINPHLRNSDTSRTEVVVRESRHGGRRLEEICNIELYRTLKY